MSLNEYPRAKSLLFVSAIKKDDFTKTFESEADAVIFDIEDSVPSDRKAEARKNILDFRSKNPDKKFFIRINDALSPSFKDDMSFIKELGLDCLNALMLARTERKEDILAVLDSLGEVSLLLLIESALGVQNLSITAAQPCVRQLTFGAFDFSLDLGLRDGKGRDFILNYVRTQLALESRVNKLLPPINRVFPNARDESLVKENMELAYSMGFSGSLTYYPNQVDITNSVFAQGDRQIKWAKEVLRLAEIHKGDNFSFEGNVIDLPAIKKAQGILANRY